MGSLVALLATDIAGSTVRWAEHESEMSDDLERHDRMVADVIVGAGGSVFKHTGDGVMAVFDDPLAAVTAAADVQAVIGSASWVTPGGLAVRVAVHAGSVQRRDGDLFGTAVNRLARLAAVCPPGAVITSGVVAGLLADRVLEGLSLCDVGMVQLRGFGRAEPVFAVSGEHLVPVPTFDTEATGGSHDGRLPRIEEDLVGRADEFAAVCSAVRANSLVSLVGVGGMGKTRLALEVAAAMESEHPDGAWWCDLTTVTRADAMAPVVLDALGARRVTGKSALDSVVEHLAGRRSLVVLDNCEHVVNPVREVVTAVRAACPGVHLVATSREALGVGGEVQVPIGSLGRDDAVRLFRERAVTARPDLGTDLEAERGIRTICEQLDGIPLAIELAAARCRSMSLDEIATRLGDRFRLLRGGRAVSERHRTLQAAVAWSYSMLDDDEREVFDAMAVFAGGSLLDGVAAVTDRDEYDVVDALDRLIARSMVTATTTSVGTRYRQLETLRQFAEDRLVERDVIEQLRDRQLGWMLDLTGRFRTGYGTPVAGMNFERYVTEVDNLRLAITHAATTDRADVAFEILARAHSGLVARPTFEALEWIDPLGTSTGWSPARAEAAAVFGGLRYLLGDPEGFNHAIHAVPSDYRDEPVVAYFRALFHLAVAADADAGEAILDDHIPRTASDRNRMASLRLFSQVVRLFAEPGACIDDAVHAASDDIVASVRATGDDLELAFALLCQAFLLVNGGRSDAALDATLEADRLARTHSAGTYIDLASNALAMALARSDGLDEGADRAAAIEVRHRLLDALERKNYYLAVAILSGTILLIVDHEPLTAHLLDQMRLRLQSGFPLLPDLVETLGAEGAAEVRARADRLDVDDATRLAINALDRLIERR